MEEDRERAMQEERVAEMEEGGERAMQEERVAEMEEGRGRVMKEERDIVMDEARERVMQEEREIEMEEGRKRAMQEDREIEKDEERDIEKDEERERVMHKESEMEMDEDGETEMEERLREEQRRLLELYHLNSERLRQNYQELIDIPIEDSPAMVDGEVVDRVSFEVTWQVLKITMMYQAGELRPGVLEDCLRTIFHLIQELNWTFHLALHKAGPTLMRFLTEVMKEIRDCTSDLLECTIRSSGDPKRIPELAMRAVHVFESLREIPRTNAAAILKALVQVMNAINSTLHLMQKEAGFPTGKSNDQKDSIKNAGGKEGEEEEEAAGEETRAVTALAIRTVTNAISVMEQLTRAIKSRDDTYVPGIVMCMENQLAKSINMSDQVNKIKVHLFPLRDIGQILEGLDGLEASVDSMECSLQPYRSTWSEFFPKSISLLIWIHELKCVLTNLSSTEVGIAG